MTQSDFGTINPTTKSGTALATDLMGWRDAVHSGNKGPTAPSYVTAGLRWVDDTLDPIWLYKFYDGTNWITMFAVDTTNNQVWTVNPGEKQRFPLAGGTANALTLTPAVAMTAYADLDVITFEAASSNTGATTLNVSAVGAKAIRKMVGGTDVALGAGDILDGGRYFLNYDTAANAAAGAWILINPSGSLSAVSTDAGATGGPDVDLFRDSASPAASDFLGRLLFYGRDSAANKELYALIYALITDPTSTSEDSQLDFFTIIAGTLASRMKLGAGLVVGAATGGDPGAGKVNAVEFQTNGVALPITLGFVSADQACVNNSLITVAHGLGVVPKIFQVVMKCVTAEGNYSVGDEVPVPYADDAGGAAMINIANNANLYFRTAVTPRLLNKTAGGTFVPTLANWRYVLKAIA